MSGSCEECGEHAVDCECEAVFDYVGDIVVTHRPIEDTCSIRVTGEDKIRFLYVGGSQYMGTNVFFNEVFLLEDAEAIRDALTTCINKIKFSERDEQLLQKTQNTYITGYHGNKVLVWDRDGGTPQHPRKYLDAFYERFSFYHKKLVTEIWYDTRNGNVGTILCDFHADECAGKTDEQILEFLNDEVELCGWYFHIEWKIIRNVK